MPEFASLLERETLLNFNEEAGQGEPYNFMEFLRFVVGFYYFLRGLKKRFVLLSEPGE